MSLARTLPSGTRVGPFEIERHLASGGMGDVYIAKSVDDGERVALKVLGIASSGAAERFEREARITGRLEHPHIVAGRGSGRTPDGTAWFAMELLEGTDLETRLARTPLSDPDIVTVGMQVCEALEYAHAHRIVHRDLKPQNIFLCKGPALFTKVLDFGIARVGSEEHLTRTGSVIGTWAYMSPEQARGDRNLDERTDLWSLGVLLYECLAGRLPFESESGPGTLFGILMEAPPDLGRLRPELPRALVRVVHTALAKSPDERFRSAESMRAALAAVDAVSLPTRERTPSVRPGILGTEDTVATDIGAIAALEGSPAVTAEVRLTSVVFIHGARDALLLEGVAHELSGRLVRLAGNDFLAVFGLDRWVGDEPFRAVRLASVAVASAQGVGVATGRIVRGARVAGAAVDTAVALATGGSLILDATTASLVREMYELEPRDHGSHRVRGPRDLARRSIAPPDDVGPLLGRDAELAMVLRSAERATSERLATGIGVIGVAGIGKTRLLRDAMVEMRKREPSYSCLTIRAEPSLRDTPFAALRDGLAGFVDPGVTDFLARTTQLGGDPVAALDRVRSSLETVLQGLAARGSIVIVVDDAHWLDPSSRATLRWIVENTFDLPLSFWIATRPEGRDIVGEIVPDATAVDLGPLPRPLAEQLVRRIADTAPSALIDRAAGHPLFLEELARLYTERGAAALAGELPASIEGALVAQLDLLDPNEREFLKRAAVFGPVFWLEGVISLGGESKALPRLQRQGLVAARPRSRVEGARELAFRTGILHEVAYSLWTADQLVRLHEQAAEWLAARGGAAADQMARHWELAQQTSRAAIAHAEAAEAAAHVADVKAACVHTERALALADDDGVRWRALTARDDVLQIATDRTLQQDGVLALVALAGRIGGRARAEAAWRECHLARLTSDADRARAAALRAVRYAAETGDLRSGAIAQRELAMLLAEESQFESAWEHATAAHDLAARTDDTWLVSRSLATQAFVIVEASGVGSLGRLAAAIELYERAADGFARAGDRRREAGARANAGEALLQIGRIDEAARAIDTAAAAATRVGNARSAAVSLHNLGVARRMLGDLARAHDLQDRAEAAARATGHTRLQGFIAVERVYLALATDTPAEKLASAADEAQRLAAATRSSSLIASAAAVAARALSRAGRDTTEDAARLRAEAAACAGTAQSVELLVAAYEAGDRNATDATALRRALESAVATLGTPDERTTCRNALCARHHVPAEIAAA